MKVIETNRFTLRKVEMNDKNDIFEILSQTEVNENLNMKLPNSVMDIEELINDYLEENKKGNKYPFAIIDRDTKEFLGVFLIKLDLFDEDCYEFTVYINPKHWGEGIYTEVLAYMVEFAFETIQTGNFRGFVMEKNASSAHVLEKCGFELEKVFSVDGLDGKIKSYLVTRAQYVN